jgi:hypothetical protein
LNEHTAQQSPDNNTDSAVQGGVGALR